MEKIRVQTRYKKLLSDLFTPVGIYLRIRDRFPGSILLESTDYHVAENSFSFICIKPLAGMEINSDTLEYKYPNQKIVRQELSDKLRVPEYLNTFLKSFEATGNSPVPEVSGLFGYTSYDAIQFFETIRLNETKPRKSQIPMLRYRFYQYVIAINHFKDELFLCENAVEGVESEFDAIETLIRSKDSPVYPFESEAAETSNMTDTEYLEMVKKGIHHCQRGDVFQIVLSRGFSRPFRGDEFNVYRTLRSINPSPYLFYFDYGDYKLLGSSPEAQLVIKGKTAVIHPIAGTFKRTGDTVKDKDLADALLKDPKENAEHVMLVDLARNDLSRYASNVLVSSYKKIQYYSHVIHLVSEVSGELPADTNPFAMLAACFPAGTLSGAPKFKAMELIDRYEPTMRSFYGGCIGFVGFNGDFNHAIMIRSMLSKGNTLYYQAGAGIVTKSDPASELQEVNNKLNALKAAIDRAEELA